MHGSEAAIEIKALWMEYETAESEEALFVKDVDKFEMILQAFEYEKRNTLYIILRLINNRRWG